MEPGGPDAAVSGALAGGGSEVSQAVRHTSAKEMADPNLFLCRMPFTARYFATSRPTSRSSSQTFLNLRVRRASFAHIITDRE